MIRKIDVSMCKFVRFSNPPTFSNTLTCTKSKIVAHCRKSFRVKYALLITKVGVALTKNKVKELMYAVKNANARVNVGLLFLLILYCL